MLIRLATPDDYDGIRQVEVAAYRDLAETMSPEDCRRLIATLQAVETPAELGQWIVAEDEGIIVGAVAFFPPHDPPTHPLIPPTWAYIRLLAVSPDHQHQGIGRRLTEFCIDRARRQGAQCLGLYTSEAMMVARGLYERMGFVIDQELPRIAGQRAWRYVLPLTHEG
jgi:predicted N-acetyltransferase YhbS